MRFVICGSGSVTAAESLGIEALRNKLVRPPVGGRAFRRRIVGAEKGADSLRYETQMRTLLTAKTVVVQVAPTAMHHSRQALAPYRGGRRRGSSPDPHSVRRREVHLRRRADGECRVPGIEVADGQGTILAGRVAVGQDLIAQDRGARLYPPALRGELLQTPIGAEPPSPRRKPCRPNPGPSM